MCLIFHLPFQGARGIAYHEYPRRCHWVVLSWAFSPMVIPVKMLFRQFAVFIQVMINIAPGNPKVAVVFFPEQVKCISKF